MNAREEGKGERSATRRDWTRKEREEGERNVRLRVEEVAEEATEEAETSVESEGSGWGDSVH